MTVRECSLCNGELTDFSRFGGGVPAHSAVERAALGGDATVQLSCKHCFHDQVRVCCLCVRSSAFTTWWGVVFAAAPCGDATVQLPCKHC